MILRSILVAVCSLIAIPAAADETCYVPYTVFEAMVPHIDLEECPSQMTFGSDGFCRLALDGDTVRLYAFRHAGDDACLERLENLSFSDFAERYGTSYSDD